MRFEFDNLGPIKHGEVELGKLTVFCGKNNTGKTYVNYLIYGFVRNLLERLDMDIRFDGIHDSGDNCIEIDVGVLYEQLHKEKENIENSFREELPRIFKINREFFDDFRLGVFIKKNEQEIGIDEFYRRIWNQMQSFEGVTLKQKNESIIEVCDINKYTRVDLHKYMYIYIAFIINDILYGYMGNLIFMLPAERSGLNMFYRELNINRNKILFNLNKQMDVNELETKVARYPLPISDYINLLNSIDAEDEENGIFNEYAATLEDKIVCGKFSVSQNGLIQFMLDDSKKLDFHLSSSTAKSLFGLDYLLKNELRPGCYLIIDEPEQNLHPDNQRYIARLVCRLTNAGVNVIVSTHSDYIIKEINNLIILANKFKGYEKLMDMYGYQEDELLPKEDVKGYIFKENTIEEVTVNEEGMQMDVFDDVINSMNEASDDIYYTYCEGKEDEQ